MTERLIQAALVAADLFREGDTPAQGELRELVRAADEYASLPTSQDHEAECLMCAVRALTEGRPAATWAPEEAGATISGVVLRQGEVETAFGTVPFVDLWQGGTGRVRVVAHASLLRAALANVAAQVGDRLQVWFDGTKEIEIPRGSGQLRAINAFSANVQRGH
jgi:hypothetical protein